MLLLQMEGDKEVPTYLPDLTKAGCFKSQPRKKCTGDTEVNGDKMFLLCGELIDGLHLGS